MTGYKIVFMGTPAFSVPALKALFEEGEKVVAVVTQPDRPKGRGRKITAPPVKIEAEHYTCRIFQPGKVNTDTFVQKLRELSPDLFIVAAYGHILSKAILSVPRFGAINIHASLLPKYRGAAPIQWAIIKGEQETGVTTMLMDAGMDTGDILMSSKVTIEPDDTAGTLHDRLAVIGAHVLITTINRLKDGTLRPVPQDSDQATYAPLLKKKDGRIDWTKSASDLDCFVRGMLPWPGAFTTVSGKTLKIYKVKPLSGHAAAPPGTILPSFPGELYVATGKGTLSLIEVLAPSGKRLKIQDFLRGHPLTPGMIMGQD